MKKFILGILFLVSVGGGVNAQSTAPPPTIYPPQFNSLNVNPFDRKGSSIYGWWTGEYNISPYIYVPPPKPKPKF